jgi:hypothetical protein
LCQEAVPPPWPLSGTRSEILAHYYGGASLQQVY